MILLTFNRLFIIPQFINFTWFGHDWFRANGASWSELSMEIFNAVNLEKIATFICFVLDLDLKLVKVMVIFRFS